MATKNFDPTLCAQTAGTTFTKTISGLGGNDIFDSVSASGIVFAALNGESIIQTVSPTTTEVVGWYAVATSAKVIYLLNIGTAPPNAEIIFARAAYAASGAATGTETGSAFSASLKVSGVFGSTVVNPATGAAWLGTYHPTAGEYRVEIVYTTTTIRIQVYSGRASTVMVEDSGTLTPASPLVASGNTFSTIRGLKYDGNTLTQTLSLLRMGYRDGTSVSTSAEPYAALGTTPPSFTTSVTPSDHTVGAVQTLTISPSGGNGNAITYSGGTWDGAALSTQTSTGAVSWTHTDTTGGTKNWSVPWSQA